MNTRERIDAILHYRQYDRMPIINFGYNKEVLEVWCRQGHVTQAEVAGQADGSEAETAINKRLGFEFNWQALFGDDSDIRPLFQPQVVEELPDGFRKVRNQYGAILMVRDGAGSIPAEVDHVLKGREQWEEEYKPRLQFSPDRIDIQGCERLKDDSERQVPVGIHCGSLYGRIRNWMGIVGLSYVAADDPQLYVEIIDTVGQLSYDCVRYTLETGAKFDYGHFWEDIAFKNGPLVNPEVFRDLVGPHYQRITSLLLQYGIDIVSLDCDGCIDRLVPVWLDNGVNTMFPIEVGVWGGNVGTWRSLYGCDLRGVGGMDKRVFSQDYAAVDREIERLQPLVDLGGYIPCPDHRMPPDAIWENVQYYCEKMANAFS